MAATLHWARSPDFSVTTGMRVEGLNDWPYPKRVEGVAEPLAAELAGFGEFLASNRQACPLSRLPVGMILILA